MRYIAPSFVLVLLLSSCVSMRQFKDLQTQHQDCRDENTRLRKENEQYIVKTNELQSKLDNTLKKLSGLEKELSEKKSELADVSDDYLRTGKRYAELQEAHNALLDGNVRETGRLLRELQSAQADLHKREDELNKLSAEVETKMKNLQELQAELENRNKRLAELEGILAEKDAAVNDLRNKVASALLGFENEGLSVTIRNGKVYVSLEEQLLFKSGRADVDPKGASALKRLARVLEQNPDINITIEGHTDDVPYIPSATIKDNWDLSVMRATAVLRILLDGSRINPERITVAGRGEHLPIDNRKTADARQKNRRTEIILTPRLDELFRILDTH